MDLPIYSPNKTFLVQFYPIEMKMSHWVNRPRLVNANSDEVLLDLSASLWHADQVRWRTDSKSVLLELRRYPGDVPATHLEINLEGKVARLPGWHTAQQTVQGFPLSQALSWLEAYYIAHTA